MMNNFQLSFQSFFFKENFPLPIDSPLLVGGGTERRSTGWVSARVTLADRPVPSAGDRRDMVTRQNSSRQHQWRGVPYTYRIYHRTETC